jgi:hypothetical protein
VKMRKLALAIAGAAAIALLSPATALAAPAPAPPSAVKLPNGTSFNPKTAKCTTVKTATGDSERCVQIQRLPLKYLTSAQRAERQRMITHARQDTSASADALPTPPAECGFSTTEFENTFTASPSRFLSCADTLLSLTVFQVSPFPELLGQFFWEDQQWVDESADSLTWTHGLHVLGYTELAFGDLVDGVSGEMYSGCFLAEGICSDTSLGEPDPQTVAIAPGGTYNFGWDESDTGSALTEAGAVDTLNPYLGVDWDIAAADQITSFTDVGALDERCDNAAQTDAGDPGDDSTVPPVDTGPGCVDQNNIPTLFLSLATYGASAAMIQWAQANESSHWGLQGVGQPLTRLASQATQRSNRTTICGPSVFTADPALNTALAPYDDQDSCDEFPFAATYQSGAQTGVTSGTACAQLTVVQTGTSNNPANEAADWAAVTTIGTPTLTENCVRGHIPLALNTGVGGAYGRFVRTNRLLNMGKFWVAVTA